MAATPPDIVLVTIDTLRADALGYAGNARVRTPNLDRIAREGVAFLDAHAHNVVTLPSHVNILTGRYPYEHGVRDNDGFHVDSKVPTLAEQLKSRGYATAAVIGAFPLDARFGLSRGFDVYDEKYPQGAREYDFSVSERPATEVVEVARSWLRGAKGRPRFLWVHLYDCHAPHAPPPDLANEFANAPYLGEVTGVDLALGPLVDDLRASPERTLLVVTSDHGEALGDHGEETHGLFGYESTLHVPLLLWGSAVGRSGPDRSLVGHVDVYPTLLEAAGAPVPADLPGGSLLRAGVAPPRRLYFEALSASLSRGWAPLRGVLAGGFKYIDLPLPELYDLASDPGESRNVVDDPSRRELVRSLVRSLPTEEGSSRSAGSSSESVARLRSLGYLSGSAPPRRRYGRGDDPKTLIGMDADIQRVVHSYQRGSIGEAIAVSRRLLSQRPSMPILYEFLSFLEGQVGRPREAIATLEEARRRGFLDENLASRLALLYSEQRRSREALATLEPFQGSTNPDVSNALGIVRATAGDVAGALREFDAALRADPRNAVAYQNIGLTRVQRGESRLALAAFDRAFALNDRLPRAWNGRGVALEQMGRHEEALQAWRRAVSLDPEQFDALYNLGVVAAEIGRQSLAREALRQFVSTAPAALFAADIARARRLLASSERAR